MNQWRMISIYDVRFTNLHPVKKSDPFERKLTHKLTEPERCNLRSHMRTWPAGVGNDQLQRSPDSMCRKDWNHTIQWYTHKWCEKAKWAMTKVQILFAPYGGWNIIMVVIVSSCCQCDFRTPTGPTTRWPLWSLGLWGPYSLLTGAPSSCKWDYNFYEQGL